MSGGIFSEFEAEADALEGSPGVAAPVETSVLIKEIDFGTAEKKSGLKDASGEDESYWGVSRILDSEITAARMRSPRSVLRELREAGYLCVLIETAVFGGVFVACCMIDRFGDKERPLHSRIVNVVFGASGMDCERGKVVNYVLSDVDVPSGTEARMESALDQ